MFSFKTDITLARNRLPLYEIAERIRIRPRLQQTCSESHFFKKSQVKSSHDFDSFEKNEK
jgi:hypothetical protein